MTDAMIRLARLRRPSLLIRAARIGLADYNRDRDLGRLTRSPTPPAPRAAFERLFADEARLDEDRRTGRAGYSASQHVELLIALLAEARLLPRAVGHPGA